MQITKFRLKEDNVYVEYMSTSEEVEGVVDEFTMKSADTPAPSLVKATMALCVDVVDMLELPSKETEKITVTGITLSNVRDKALMTGTIIAKRELNNSNSPQNLVTPSKRFEVEVGEGEDTAPNMKVLLSDDCIKRFNKLVDEVESYIKGNRSQLGLFGHTEAA